MINQFIEEILAIIVIYNKDLKDSDSLKTISNQLSTDHKLDLVIYDNSPQPQLTHSYDGINIIQYNHSDANIGVSKAYNQGAELAKKLKKKWILLLDQDTLFQDNLIQSFFQAVNANSEINLFCPIVMLQNGNIFSPFKRVSKRGAVLKQISSERYPTKQFSPVNSGMLIRLTDFFQAKGYNDKVRLDFSDMQFMERFAKYNDWFFVVNSYALQDFSNDETDISKLNTRFKIFCEGALNCDRNSWSDDFQYLLIAFIRASSLFARTKKIIFYKTFFNYYLFKRS